jgi:hypothetical protein
MNQALYAHMNNKRKMKKKKKGFARQTLFLVTMIEEALTSVSIQGKENSWPFESSILSSISCVLLLSVYQTSLLLLCSLFPLLCS